MNVTVHLIIFFKLSDLYILYILYLILQFSNYYYYYYFMFSSWEIVFFSVLSTTFVLSRISNQRLTKSIKQQFRVFKRLELL